MRIRQLLLPGASWFERKSQQLDRDALIAAGHEIADDADITHVYSPYPLPTLKLKSPFVANARPQQHWWRRASEPAVVISPLKDTPDTFVPEAIDDAYFAERTVRKPDGRYRLGTFDRERVGVNGMIERTLHRMHRFRDDIDWLVFDHPPSFAELEPLDAWVDPTTSESNFDGCVAEALACGLPVVAVRTAINLQRMEKGRTGLLSPPDPNELTHAILGALFKAEVYRPRIDAARQTISKFRARQRVRHLVQIYENLGK